MSHLEDKEARLTGSLLPRPACLFTNQSITLCSPIVINQASSSFSPPPLWAEKWRTSETLTRRRSDNDGMSLEGWCRCYLANGTIVPGPVKCCPGSAEGSRRTFSRSFISWMRQGLIMLIYKTILDKYTTFRDKCMGVYAFFSEQPGCHLQRFKDAFRSIWRKDIHRRLNLWKKLWKFAHMVFISPSEKHHDLPGSAIHIKLNHIHRLRPMTDSFTSFHRPYRETTAPINLTSKNVQK